MSLKFSDKPQLLTGINPMNGARAFLLMRDQSRKHRLIPRSSLMNRMVWATGSNTEKALIGD